MKFTRSWLGKFLDTDASIDQISDALTALGLEVESVTDPAGALEGFKIAQIVDAQPHPNADKLRVCKVNTGENELQIVCGAPNARAGINVVLAPVGSVIPTNGMKIKASAIRGVESNGMLCSAAELGLGQDHAGIIEMPASNDNLAQDYAKVAGLDDPVFDIAITPDRGDCLGVYGIARDLAAAGIGELKSLDIPSIATNSKKTIDVSIEEHDACGLFIGRVFEGVSNGPSPDWLQRDLQAIGLNPISALVDITNYIAYSFGRPLHVYDADQLSGGLNVRYASHSEAIEALDHKSYSLDDSMLVIADNTGPQAIAGIIGGAHSGCQENTTNVVLELAVFDPIIVAATGRKLDIITDSRYRFERGVDLGFVHDAMAITTHLILELCGGEAGEVVIAGNDKCETTSVLFKVQDVKKLTGLEVDEASCNAVLDALGFVRDADQVIVPSWRHDIDGTADIVEEVVRVIGYDHIPVTPLPVVNQSASEDYLGLQMSKATRFLATAGLNECVTWSFMSSERSSDFVPNGAAVPHIKNPISSQWDVMRPSMVPNLLDVVARNISRGFANLGLFETGLVYHGQKPEEQKSVVTIVRSGKAIDRNCHEEQRDVDFFDAKADAYNILQLLGVSTDSLRVSSTGAPLYYHPGRKAVLMLGKAVLAYVGQVHPKVAVDFDVEVPVVVVELFLDALPPQKKKATARKALQASEYQLSTRDFAFILDDKVPVGDVLKAVVKCDKALIEDVTLFDVYQGEHVQDGKKSVAFSVIIRAMDHTLTEDELDNLSKKVIESVTKLGGELRA